ncbi:helix-turn-helix transcriptional regulator [Pectobacterium carotovorum]|uniref:helix-turn-helix transcriptional regulator n=1 Tax=Pectobacterium carotovorum TaxID=554 RepID=UPI001937C041|nr:PAS domain-containing protein [Pectobacterium versatile]
MAIKDSKNQYITANTAFMALLKLPADYPISGKTLAQLPSPSTYLSTGLHKQEDLVMSNRARFSSIVTQAFGFSDSMHALCFDSSPLYDDEGNCAGTMLLVRSLDFFCPSSLLEGEVPKPMNCNRPSNFFTNAEWEVIFLISMKYRRKQMAKILNLSLKAVEHRISNCLQKTGSSCGEDLMQYCRKKQWDTYVPPRFLKPRFRLFKSLSSAPLVDSPRYRQ